MTTRHDHRRFLRAVPRPVQRAFTLVELVVVIVILSILASLTLSGLAGARQRAKIDKTRSTIRKLHEIVIPMYESYVERRVAATNVSDKVRTDPSSLSVMLANAAGYQVASKRFLAAADMPDLWDDAWDGVNNYLATDEYWGQPVAISFNRAPNARYQAIGSSAFQATMPDNLIRTALAYESAECLQMIVVRGGHAADAAEQFRADEIGDVDKDGLPEFHDGWGRPISFIRWPTGFVSVLQASQDLPPDPMDPLGATRHVNGVSDRAVVPLIYSGGPNNALDADGVPPSPSAGSYGLITSREAVVGSFDPAALAASWQQSGWINMRSAQSPWKSWDDASGNGLRTTRWPGTDPGLWAGAVKRNDPRAVREASDNITNHDLVTK